MDQAPSNPQADPHGTVNPLDVHERSNPVQTAAQTVAGLSALAIFGLIATPVVLIVILVALAIFAR